MESPHRIILTAAESTTGIGNYVADLLRMQDLDTTTYSFIMNRESKDEMFFGTKFHGLKIPITKNGWYINVRFQKFVFRKVISMLRELYDSMNVIYHYSDYSLRSFTPVDNSCLTLHDFFGVLKKYPYKYGNWFTEKFKHKKLEEFKSYKYLIADSKRTALDAEEYGFESKAMVIYPPLREHIVRLQNKQELRNKWGIPIDKKIVLSISSDDPRKNLSTISKTMSILGDQFILLRVGSNLPNAINFSNLSPNDVNELYNSSDVLLFPTLAEGFGYPLIEAMAIGLPIVTSDIEITREVCGDAAIFVDPDSPSCKEGVIEAIANKEELLNSGIRQSKKFEFDRFCRSMLRLYERMS